MDYTLENIEQLFSSFRRVNNDLTLQMHISLVEALCGFQKPIKTLDDRTIVISAIPGKFVVCKKYSLPTGPPSWISYPCGWPAWGD